MTTDALNQLSDDDIDELISASIDGELHAAVMDMGIALPVTAVEEWLATEANVVRRHALLANAAARFGSLDTHLDEITRRRMIKSALAATQPDTSRWQRRASGIAAVAASAVLVVGIAASVRRTASNSPLNVAQSVKSSAPNPQESAIDSLEGHSAGGPIADLGQIHDVRELGARLEQLAKASNAPTTTTTTRPRPVSERAAEINRLADAASCAPTLPGAASTGGINVIGTATLGREPIVIVSGIRADGSAARWAYRTSDCVVVFASRA